MIWVWVSDSARGHENGRSRALLVSPTQSALWEGLLYLFQHIPQQWRLITFSVDGDRLISLGPRKSKLHHAHTHIFEYGFCHKCFGPSTFIPGLCGGGKCMPTVVLCYEYVSWLHSMVSTKTQANTWVTLNQSRSRHTSMKTSMAFFFFLLVICLLFTFSSAK